jgi:hypothetical protein
MSGGIRVLLTVQNRSEVFHISQIVRADPSIRTNGIKHFPAKAYVDFWVLGEHGYRERHQTGSLASSSAQLLCGATMNVPCHDRPA